MISRDNTLEGIPEHVEPSMQHTHGSCARVRESVGHIIQGESPGDAQSAETSGKNHCRGTTADSEPR